MILKLHNLEPCPRNRSHTIVTRGKFAQNIKTEAARMYEAAIAQLLKPYKEQRDTFLASFEQDIHAIQADFYHGTPKLYTATGKINLNSLDLDAHKVLKDCIAQFIGIDDGYTIKDSNSKFYSPDYTTIIKLSIIPKGFTTDEITLLRF